ncbi:uncharacterized protein [Hyperolius riggenbachi]|uniref:uncharacterized protein n=1 Tax=Hyperolius riggenbachi TaxID=752182 RepID=UPI0035A3B6AE
MPKCFAKGCANTTGKKGMSPDVMLYKFPREPELLRQWCHNIGVPDDIMDRLIEEVIEDKRGDKYRLCSCHFLSSCLYTTEEKKALKSDAVPTVFSPDSEAVKRDKKWHHALFKRMRTQPPSTASGGVTVHCCLCKFCVCPCHKQVSNASTTQATTSTQTEAIDFDISNAHDPNIIELLIRSRSMDHAYPTRKQTQETSPCTPEKEQDEIPPPLNSPPIKVCVEHIPTLESPSTSSSGFQNCPKEVFYMDSSTTTPSSTASIPKGNYYKDEDYVPYESELTADCNVSSDSENTVVEPPQLSEAESVVHDHKFIVFESCLDTLLSKLHCPIEDCFEAIRRIEKKNPWHNAYCIHHVFWRTQAET